MGKVGDNEDLFGNLKATASIPVISGILHPHPTPYSFLARKRAQGHAHLALRRLRIGARQDEGGKQDCQPLAILKQVVSVLEFPPPHGYRFKHLQEGNLLGRRRNQDN